MEDRNFANLIDICSACDASRCQEALSKLDEKMLPGPISPYKFGECLVACADAAGPSPDSRINCFDCIMKFAVSQVKEENASSLQKLLVNYRRKVDGLNSLLICALQNRPSLILYLVETYADVLDTLAATLLEETPLFVAIRWNNIRCALALLKHTKSATKQANKPVMDGTNYTCLHLASFHGSASLVTVLIDLNVDMSALDNKGNHALHLAARYGHTKIVEQLCDSGASLQHRNHQNQRPVDVAISANMRMCQLLLYEYMEAKKDSNTSIIMASEQVGVENAELRQDNQEHLYRQQQDNIGESQINEAMTTPKRMRHLFKNKIPSSPHSFSPEKVKYAYASTPFNFRAATAPGDKQDDIMRDYVPRFLHAYSMCWPESLLPENRGSCETVCAQVNEFVYHTCRCLPKSPEGIWGKMGHKFIASHRRSPFKDVKQAGMFLSQLVSDARLVAIGDEDSLRRQREREPKNRGIQDNV